MTCRPGHAIEVRLYAEEPAADYQPQSGVLTRFEIPAGEGIRVDAGYESGSTVSTFYDAMLAKVVCHAPTREAAARKLADALARARIHGVVDQPRPARRRCCGRRVPRRRGRAPPSCRTNDGSRLARATRPRRRGGGDRAGRAGGAAAHRPARDPGRLAQRAEPARSAPSSRAARVVEWWCGRDGYVVDGIARWSTREPRRRVTLEADGVRTTYDVAITGADIDVDGPTGHSD